MSRESFLARVRQAAQAGLAYRVHTVDLPDTVGYCGAGDDPSARFVAEVNAVGGQGQLVADWNAAREALAELLDRYSPARALCWRHPVLDRLNLGELLAAKGVERLDYDSLCGLTPAEQRERMLAAEIGISSATLAVAETGSLALSSGPGTERVASLLPPVHVAIVSADQIVPDLFDLFAVMQKSAPAMPSNWTLVTGPSKTGDLELKLTTGVHGPGIWHVIAVGARVSD
ncbi:MAG TPA: lactate utilization protein [Pirellulales bacterium]|jgi:L-lactate dehydrogenase complex protein LldG|nr:lactate utilization protein [Pirellulales bacterium]